LSSDDGLFEALPGRVLRSVDHAALQPLVDAGAHASILVVMDELSVPVQTLCYECRLAERDRRVDVAVCLLPMHAVGPGGVLGRLGQRRGEDPAWQRCLELLTEWSGPSSWLAPRIPFVCVAFDGPGEPASLAAPGLSLCVDPDFFARQLKLPVPPPPPGTEILAVSDECHRRLHGEPLPAGCAALLEAALADNATLAKHVSLMVSRTPATFKLDVRLPVDRVAALLRRIGWPGEVSRVTAHIDELMPWRGHVQLNLVLHPAQGPSLEVELLTGRREVGLADRTALLQRLVDAGHCDPAKAEVLRDAWARPVTRGSDGLIVARSWYLKVRLDGNGIVEVKAYLGLMPRVLYSPRAAIAVVEAQSAGSES
jgi:hypothetical protein